MTSETGQHIITIHILLNISRSKDNQAIKFGQPLKYSHSSKIMRKMRKGD